MVDLKDLITQEDTGQERIDENIRQMEIKLNKVELPCKVREKGCKFCDLSSNDVGETISNCLGGIILSFQKIVIQVK